MSNKRGGRRLAQHGLAGNDRLHHLPRYQASGFVLLLIVKVKYDCIRIPGQSKGALCWYVCIAAQIDVTVSLKSLRNHFKDLSGARDLDFVAHLKSAMFGNVDYLLNGGSILLLRINTVQVGI